MTPLPEFVLHVMRLTLVSDVAKVRGSAEMDYLLKVFGDEQPPPPPPWLTGSIGRVVDMPIALDETVPKGLMFFERDGHVIARVFLYGGVLS